MVLIDIKRWNRSNGLIISLLLFFSCSNYSYGSNTLQRLTKETVGTEPVKHFVYQLQNSDLQAIGTTSFDLVIIDYSFDGSIEEEFTGDQINVLKNSSGVNKIILAYMSIGEAEEYRFYWQDSWMPGNPVWLDHENPEWEGNYKVHYWNPDWQTIIFNYTDRLLDAGFDGAYLDLIDTYEFYADQGRSTAAQEMADFVSVIAAYAHASDPDFFIFVQNAAELGTIIPEYINTVDGIGQEDIYYGYDADGVATPLQITSELESNLNLFRDRSKLILTIDYPFTNSEDIPHFDDLTLMKINDAYSRSLANGYIPYCTVRNLNYLTINPGHEPTAVFEKSSENAIMGFRLYQNFPNPFNTTTLIEFTLPESEMGQLEIVNMSGQLVRIYAIDGQSQGNYFITWDGKNELGIDAPSGIYLYRLKIQPFVQTKKLMLIR